MYLWDTKGKWYWESKCFQFYSQCIVHIYKRKGNRQLCDNNRRISLLAIAGKILARVLLDRLLGHLEQANVASVQAVEL